MAAKSRARGVARMVDVLDFLAKSGRPAVINEIAEAIGAPKSSLYELADFMLSRSLLETVDRRGRVYLGPKLHMYAAAFKGRFPLLEAAKPFVRELASDTGEIVELCSIVDGRLGILFSDSGSRPYWWNSPAGAQFSLPLSSAGQLLCAHMSASEIEALIPGEDFRSHDGMVLAIEQFMAMCREARAKGYASASGLMDRHLAAISLPLSGQGGVVKTILGIAYPSGEGDDRRDIYIEKTRHTCARILEAMPPEP